MLYNNVYIVYKQLSNIVFIYFLAVGTHCQQTMAIGVFTLRYNLPPKVKNIRCKKGATK